MKKRNVITLRQLELTNKKEFERVMTALIKNRREPMHSFPHKPQLSKREFHEKLYLTIKKLVNDEQ